MRFAIMLAAVLNADPDSFESRDERAFATYVMLAAKGISQNHITKATPRQLVEWAIEGTYASRRMRIPATIRKRMESLAKAEDDDVVCLLRDVYADVRADGSIDALENAFADAVQGCVVVLNQRETDRRRHQLYLVLPT